MGALVSQDSLRFEIQIEQRALCLACEAANPP